MPISRFKKVIVGLSGGVDSSVAAAVLLEKGYRVEGLLMRNWEEHLGECPWEKDHRDVLNVCDQLQIKLHTVNFAKQYREEVFGHFLSEYAQGRTPNPDILCNREIKFKHFYAHALSLGADLIATGHYCLARDNKLFKGHDDKKDQSYFLHAIDPKVLKNVLFPLGEWPKSLVRVMAKKWGLPTAAKKDSTGICFIGEKNFRPFLKRYLAPKPGKFLSLDGQHVGNHHGAQFYTIGQRKGLGLGGAGEPWFVVEKNMQKNCVYVVRGAGHPRLYKTSLTATNLSWISPPPKHFPFHCLAKIRYRQADQICTLKQLDPLHLSVEFKSPQWAVSPGQSIVFYTTHGECLGGGVIDSFTPLPL